MLRLIATATMAGLIALFGLVPARAAPGYGTYVEALLAKPPERRQVQARSRDLSRRAGLQHAARRRSQIACRQ